MSTDGVAWGRAGTALLTVMLALGAGLVVGSGSAAPAPRGNRAMWVWTRPVPEDLVDFARERGVSELMVAVPPSLASSGDLPWLRHLAALAGEADIRLVALGGRPQWTTDHAAALAWQRSALATGLFAASHVDVEPYQLPSWDKARNRTASAYLGLLAELQAASPAPLEAAVPWWYGDVRLRRGTLADAVLARVDAVTAMSYRDTVDGPGGMLDVGADLLERGSALGKPVRLGAETNPQPSDDGYTFAEEGAAVLSAALSRVDTDAAPYVSFAGVAVSDYEGWRALRP